MDNANDADEANIESMNRDDMEEILVHANVDNLNYVDK